MKYAISNVVFGAATLAATMLVLPASGMAQYRYAGPRSLIKPYYQGANTLYQQQMRRRGVQSPGSIGSPQFFRRNFPRPSWQDYSSSTGGLFVKPRHCVGPYC